MKELQKKPCEISSSRVTTEPREETTAFIMCLDCEKRSFLKNLLYAHTNFPPTLRADLVQSQVPDAILPLPIPEGGFAKCCLQRVSNSGPKAQRLAKENQNLNNKVRMI